MPIMRYPGGNFVSGYHWLDGVGPKDKRPTVLERAWNSIETNQFGTNEFIEWCKLVDTEPLLGFNLGTGTPEDGRGATSNTATSKREPNGATCAARTVTSSRTTSSTGAWATKWTARGKWAIMTAREYGRKARDSARQIRVIDPDPNSSPAARATPSCLPTWSGTAKCSRNVTTRSTAFLCTIITATRRRDRQQQQRVSSR